MNPGDTCYIRTGIYAETVIPKNDGSQGRRLTFINYNNEEVTVSGCNQITNWIPDGKTEGIFKAPMDWSLGDRGDQNQVFANGELMYEARYPNVQPNDTLVDFTFAKTGAGTGVSKDKIPAPEGETPNYRGEDSYLVDPKFKEFAKTADFFDGAKIWMVPGLEWTSLTSYATSYDPDAGKITFPTTFRAKKRDSTYYVPGAGNPYYVFGAYKLIDVANEWWYDTANKMLHVKIADGKNPDEAGVYIEAKKRLNAFDLSNRSFINITGVNVRGATIITDKDSTYITMKDMKCEYVGHNSSIEFSNLTINDSEQDDLGVLLKGKFIEVNSCEISNSSGPVVNLQGSDNSLINSYIHDGNYIGTFTGHTKLSGRRQFVSNNTMTRSGRDVISFRDLSESIIQYNDISHAGYLTKDLGMMYSANTDGQNTQIHHNYIHDNHALGNNNGFYPDESTHNFITYQNVICNSTTGMALNHPSLYNLTYNNTVYDRSNLSDTYNDPTTWQDAHGRQFINNILSDDNSPVNGKPNSQATFCRSNFLSSAGQVGYVDAKNQDFRLASGANAIGYGSPIRGITDPTLDAPSVGAFEKGQELFEYGHNFETPPTIIPAPSEEVFEYRNLVSNGGFEFGTLQDWNETVSIPFEDSWHSNAKTSSTGYYGAILQPNEVLTQSITGLEPNTSYTVALQAKALVANQPTSVEFGVVGQVETKDVSSIKWTTNTRCFQTVTTGTNETSLVVTVKNVGANSLNIDDIGMQKDVVDIGILSKEVTAEYNHDDYTIKLTFDAPENGNKYFYSELQTADPGFATGRIAGGSKPRAYNKELTSGTVLSRVYDHAVNIVETSPDGKLLGYGKAVVPAAPIATKTISPSKDTYVYSRAPTTQLTDEEKNSIRLSNNAVEGLRTGYLQFDLTDVVGKNLTSANLEVYVYATNPSGTGNTSSRKIKVTVMPEEGAQKNEDFAPWTEEWDENTLTYGTSPEDGGTGIIMPSVSAPFVQSTAIANLTEPNGRLVKIDILSLLKAQCGKKITLQLASADVNLNRDIYIASKENATYNSDPKKQTLISITEKESAPFIDSVPKIDTISVPFGTPYANVTLPTNVDVNIANSNDPISLPVTWDKGEYDGEIAGNYLLTGAITLQDGIMNPDNKTAVLQVTVKQPPLEGPSIEELKDLIALAKTKTEAIYTTASIELLKTAISAAEAIVLEVETALGLTTPSDNNENVTPPESVADVSDESLARQLIDETEKVIESLSITPVVEAPVVEAPVVEAPVVEAPVVEAPVVETPVVETPVVETPVVEAPVVETPKMTDELQAKINLAFTNLQKALDELVNRIFFTVTFKDGASVLSTTQIEENLAVKAPGAPSKAGYTFVDWFDDAACTTKYDFATLITGNKAIYSAWTQDPIPEPEPKPESKPKPEPEPAPKPVQKKDIAVEFEGGAKGTAIISKDVTNVVNPTFKIDEVNLSDDTAKSFIDATENTVLQIFDINLFSKGIEVTQVDGGFVEVSLQYNGDAKNNYVVLRYNDDKTITELAATYENGSITFNTDHFSLYAIAIKTEKAPVSSSEPEKSVSEVPEEKPESKPSTSTSTSVPETKGGSPIIIIVIILLVAIIGVVIVIIRKNKRE